MIDYNLKPGRSGAGRSKPYRYREHQRSLPSESADVDVTRRRCPAAKERPRARPMEP